MPSGSCCIIVLVIVPRRTSKANEHQHQHCVVTMRVGTSTQQYGAWFGSYIIGAEKVACAG
jgi:hypothetical protein